MKILTLSNSLLVESQGSGYVIMNYVRRLRERGHDVDVLGPAELVDLRRPPRAMRYRQALAMARAAWAGAGHYDVIEIYGGEAWLAVECVRRRRTRPLLVAHSNGLETLAVEMMAAAPGSPPRRWYRPELGGLHRRAFEGVDALVTVSGFDRDYAAARRYQPEDRLLAIDNPLPDAYLSRPIDHERPPRIVFCGSWIARKGVDIARRELAGFLEERSGWTLALAGVGAGFSLEDNFAAPLRSRIEVIPQADRDTTLRDLYSTSRIAVQPSYYESFGLAAAEAMACGCALVASRVGFAHALADGREALLHEPGDGRAMRQALLRLADDEGLRRRIATHGHARVQGLRWEAAVDSLESHYGRWLAQHRAARDRMQ